MKKIISLIQNVLTSKQLAKITKQLSSMHLATGPLVRLFTRNMYHEIRKQNFLVRIYDN